MNSPRHATPRFSPSTLFGTILFGALVLSGSASAVSALGLEHIAATDTEIEIHLGAEVAGDVRLVEIEPYDTLNPARGLTSERPDNASLDFSQEGFLRMTFLDSAPFDPQIQFPEHPVNADFVGQFSMRARLSGPADGGSMPIRLFALPDSVLLSLPADGEWHTLRADLTTGSWSGMKTLRIDPADDQEFAANAQAVLDIDWVAVTYRDDFVGDRNRTGWDVFIDLGVPPSSWTGPAQAKIVLPRFDGARDRLFSKYLLLDGETSAPIGSPRYVTDLSGLSYQHDSTQGWTSLNTSNGMPNPVTEGGVLRAPFDTPSGVWDPALRAAPTDRANLDLAREFAMRYRLRGYGGRQTFIPIALYGTVQGQSGIARFDDTVPPDGEWHIYRATLDQSNGTLRWQGNVSLRIDLPNADPVAFPAVHFAGAVLEIDWVAISDDPLFLPGQPAGEGSRVWTFSDERTAPLLTPTGFKGVDGRDFADKVDLGVQVNKTNFIHAQAIALGLDAPMTWPVDEFEVGINPNFITNNLRNGVKLLSDNQAATHIVFLNSLQPYWLDEGTATQRANPLRNILTSNDSPNTFSVAHNVMDPLGLAHFRGALEFMGRFFSDPSGANGQIFRFTIGNEVDAHWSWYNAGDIELDALIDIYLTACRVADLALRSQHPDYRIKLSFTHHWNGMNPAGPLRAGKPKEFLERFAQKAREEGDFPWAINLHPYPENLRDQEFWNDTTPSDSFNTPRITFKNLHVIRRYLQQESMLYQGRVRPITLGEQGFDVVTDGDPTQEAIQAAALAYSFKIVEQIPDIEAYLYHRQTDHPDESALLFGLWAGNPDEPDVYQSYRKRPSWFVMRDYASPHESATLDPYLAYLPLTDWSEINLADIRLHYAFDRPDSDIFTRNLPLYEIADGLLSGTVRHGDPQIVKENVNTYGDGQTTVRIRLKTGQDGDWQLFWKRAGDPGFAAARVATFAVEAGAEFREYEFDLSAHPDWTGHNIVGWRLDPAGTAGSYDFAIDSLIFGPPATDAGAETSFASWIAGFHLTEAESAPLATPAGDGVTNLVKYALDLPPTQSAAGVLPAARILEEGRFLSLEAVVRSDDASLSATAQASIDLVNWDAGVIELEGLDQANVPDGFTRRAWRTVDSVTGGGRLFLRLAVRFQE